MVGISLTGRHRTQATVPPFKLCPFIHQFASLSLVQSRRKRAYSVDRQHLKYQRRRIFLPTGTRARPLPRREQWARQR
jgi:hypothetical protein